MLSHPAPPTVPRVDEARCQACGECLARKACRLKAIVAIDPGEAPFVDSSLCYGCLVCLPACPFEALAV